MRASTARKKRFLEIGQVVLAFASVCAVAAYTRGLAAENGPGRHFTAPHEEHRAVDRRFNDLARVERKRREAEQRRSRGSAATTAAMDAREYEILPITSAEALHPATLFAQIVADWRHLL